MMDLSHNNFSGSIPPCLNNLTFGAQDGIFLTTDGFVSLLGSDLATYSYESQISLYTLYIEIQSGPSNEAEKVDFTTKWRFESYEGKVLSIMSGMDLSWNNLTGSIPPELGDLSEIHSINLSGNHLTGSIPETFSNLKAIESLDLSHNMLIGQIPPRMIELNNLAVFTVAYNDLSGKLPERKAQFATFEESSYEGNPLLCGLPLNRSCSPARAAPKTPPANSDNEEKESWEVSFLWSFGGSFGVAFFGIIAFLYFNSYYRELLFYFIAKNLTFLRL